MAHPNVTTQEIADRFRAEAGTRFPRRGFDYDPIVHKYTENYLNPSSYRIFVDAFPGGSIETIIDPEADQLPPGTQHHGPPAHAVITQRLNVPIGTYFEYTINGRGPRLFPGSLGPARTFSATRTQILHSTRGGREFFSQADAAWRYIVDVPWPGTFELSVSIRTPAGASDTKNLRFTLKDRTVVSIGDSAASGQGNPDVPGKPADYHPDVSWFDILVSTFVPGAVNYALTREVLNYAWDRIQRESMTVARALDYKMEMDPKPEWLEPNAYRSLRSGPAFAARLLEDRPAGEVVTFLPFGRTGSTIQSGLLARRSDTEDQWIGAVGQIEEVERSLGRKRIDALIIQIGINDLDATGTLKNLLTSDFRLPGDPDQRKVNRDIIRDVAMQKIAVVLPVNLGKLKAALSSLNIRDVYLTEYPTGLFDMPNGEAGAGCELFDDLLNFELSGADTKMLKGLAEELNKQLEAQAEALEWGYISGIAREFEGRGYCTDSDRRYFVRAKESLASQGDTEGTIHPNYNGSLAVGTAMAAAVRSKTFATDEGQLIKSVPEMIANSARRLLRRRR
ncbi:hypothetical protein ACIA5G_30365 [Amycolatopsis sp. NPDC051758]|uniref:hypothetical protein n=1 Tax=Amycolatopsis sp. NPDC051758 TaxID=3363935 RepID=UPI0037ADEED0